MCWREVVTFGQNYNNPFSLDELTDAISKSHDTAVGSDDIHYQMLKHLSNDALLTLLNILNKIWDSGNFPTSWCTSTVIPVPKPGKDTSDPSNYRLLTTLHILPFSILNFTLYLKENPLNYLLLQCVFQVICKRLVSKRVMLLHLLYHPHPHFLELATFSGLFLHDSRHFQYCYIAISQWKIIRFWWTLGSVADNELDDNHVTKNKCFQNSRWRTAAILIIAFWHNFSNDCPISAKFCNRNQNDIPTKVTWQKLKISKIQDTARWSFWK